MDNRLVLTVLFVTLSWMSAGTYGQTATNIVTANSTNMTTAAGNMTDANMTTAAGDMTGANMTTAAGDMTGANMTTAAGNMTDANMTTAAGDMTGANMTTAAGNMTDANMTTAAGDMTDANMTTAAGDMTGANMTTAAENMTDANMTTAAGNDTTAAPTLAPALTPNTTVETLETTISRAGCGTEKLCGTEPADCDPSTPGSCFFGSIKQRNGSNDLEFQLSGESEGYIACTLSPDSTLGGDDETYVCANNNGKVQFFGTVLNNGQLTMRTLNANSVKGRVNGSQIQCTFAATAPSPLARAGTQSFAVAISTGPFNSSAGTLGTPTSRFQSPVVDVTNPNATATNIVTANATNMTTAAGNMTGANMTTAAGNDTTAAPTLAPALTPNTTVETLETTISRAGCGSQKLCGTEPADCDPSTPGSCFFGSFNQRTNSRDFDVELSGESEGYIACTLSPDSTLGGNDETYVCANNNGKVQFFGTVLNNGQLTMRTLNVNSVKGRVNGSKIQCTFAATAPFPLLRAGTESFAIGISTGPFNSSAGTLGAPTSRFLSPVVDLGNANATTTNTLTANTNTTTTTASPNTTSHGLTLRQSLTQVVLMTVGVLSLATL